MDPAVARLVELMPPPAGVRVAVEWAALAEEWGTQFPADYREFIEVYGGGSINASFHICAPSETGYAPLQATGLREATELGFELLGDDEDALAEAEGRICWALDAGADHAYWDTTDPDPDRCTVMVLERHGEWVRYDCGMAEFVVFLLTAESDLPMALFDPRAPNFEAWARV